MVQRFFEKYTGFLRSLKAVYVINNLFNARKLAPNKRLYKQFHLSKSIFAPLGSRDFGGVHHPDVPWIDRQDALAVLPKHPEFATFAPEVQEQMLHFVQNGFMVVKGFFPQADTDALNAEVDLQLKSGKAGFNYSGRKIFNFFEQSGLADQRFFKNPELLRLLSFLLGKPVIPFQTLNFTHGSEQKAHSDSIHMTTEPPGYLIATWIALEDCSMDSGALIYYPGSHRLPFITTEHYDSGNTALTIGDNSNKRYEDKIAQVIAENKIEKQYFLAKRGDVLVWHANLLHGGSPITREGATRKSMVCHYFAEGVLCYHEISQRPAIL